MPGESHQKDKGNEINVPREGSRTVGPYRLVRELGQGGMGIVYEATHEESGQRVALKLMSRRLVQGEAHRKRFDREMIVATMLDHPGITSLLDFGEHDGEPYYAMEYVEGWPLDAAPQEILLKLGEQGAAKLSEERAQSTRPASRLLEQDKPQEQPTPLKERFFAGARTEVVFGKSYFSSIAGLALQAADALHYAHERGVIHRDIKPSNLMLTPERKIKILDFGLAKAADLETLTTTGDFFGTPAYMSPEQAAGEVSQIDRRSDVYSLGATLYQLLTGRAPFTGETRVVASAILNRQPVEPRKLDRRIPGPLNALVSKAIEKRREDRYQSAKELADDLRRYLSGSRVKAKQGSLRWRLRKALAKRKKEAVLVSSSLLVIAASFAGVLLYRSGKQQRYERLLSAASDSAENGQFARAVEFLREAGRLNDTTEVRLKLWHAMGQLDTLVPGSGDHRFSSLAFSPSGRLVAAGDSEGAVRLWDTLHQDEPPPPLLRHNGKVTALCFSTDEKLLAFADPNGDLAVWNISQSRQEARSQGNGVEVYSLAFMPGGRELFMADRAARLVICDPWAQPNNQRQTHQGKSKFSWNLIRPNQTVAVFAAVGQDEAGQARAGIFEMASANPLFSVALSGESPCAVAASEGGDQLALGYRDGAIWLCSTEGDSPRLVSSGGRSAVAELAFFQGDRKLLACHGSGALEVWDVRQQKSETIIASACGGITTAAASRDGAKAILAPVAGGLRLLSTDSDQVQPSGRVLALPSLPLKASTPAQCKVAFSARGTFVASGDVTGVVTVWDTGSGKAITSGGTHGRIAGGHYGIDVRGEAGGLSDPLHRPASSEMVELSVNDPPYPGQITPQQRDRWYTFTVSLRGTYTIETHPVAGEKPVDTVIFLYDAAQTTILESDDDAGGEGFSRIECILPSGAYTVRVSAADSPVTSLSFSPRQEGVLVYSTEKDRAVSVYDITTGQERELSLLPDDETVQSVAFHPNGHLIASGDRNARIVLWDLDSFARIADNAVKSPWQVIACLRFLPELDMLIAWTTDGRAWYLRVPDLLPTSPPFGKQRPAGVHPIPAAIGPNGRQMTVVFKTGNVGTWDFVKNRPIRFETHSPGPGAVRCLAFSDTGEIIASAREDMRVTLWDVKRRREAVRLWTEPGDPRCLAFDPLTSWLGVGLNSGKVILYNLAAPSVPDHPRGAEARFRSP
jgi:serine/threonine protein kinase/WD40 repeat protein